MILFLPTTADAKRLYSQSKYKRVWCPKRGGQVEVKLMEGVRCDCITKTHAIEFDFAEKWPEAVGESLFFSQETGKKAGIVLILETQDDAKYWLRLKSIIEHHKLPIDTWIITPLDLKK
jgi:hypothetical protein